MCWKGSASLDNELKKFINKQLLYHERKCQEAQDNYQETGKQSTYNTMVKHGYYHDALLLALGSVNEVDKSFEKYQRHMNYIKQKADEIFEYYSCEEALKLILKEINGLSYFKE